MPSFPQAVSLDNFDDLMTAARHGNKEAQGRLLEAFRRPLLRLARQRVDLEVQAKGGGSDMVQETFIRALREIDTFQGCTPDQLMAWLRAIMESTAANFRRRFQTKKRDAAREVSEKGALTSDDLRRATPAASDGVIRDEQDHRVRETIERLPEPYREVVRLRSQEQLSFREIGQRIGRTEESARKLWMRAVAQMGENGLQP